MPNLRGSEWLIIILLVVLLFGAKRLPDAARSIGRSLRIFKAETKGLVDESAGTPPAGPPAAVAGGAQAGALEAGNTAAVVTPAPAVVPEPVAQAEPAPALAPRADTPTALHPQAPAPGQTQA
jgi:sec-independent protein translocase protein TatA